MLLVAALCVRGAPQTPPVTVLINEISPLPLSDDEPTWVELLNVSQAPVDLSGWSLWDRWGCRLVFADETSELAPAGLVVVWFRGEEEASPARTFAREAGMHIDQVGEDAADAFRQQIGECALFAAPDRTPQALRDYVCWGDKSSSQTATVLRAAGVLAASGHALSKFGCDGCTVLEIGGTLGRSPRLTQILSAGQNQASSDLQNTWDYYAPGEVSPGRPNRWPAPAPHSPILSLTSRTAEFVVDYPVTLLGPPQEACRLQVAERPSFQQPLVDRAYAPGERLRVDGLAPGTYYWRARLERDDMVTPWSEGYYLELRDPNAVHEADD
jgi:hypothetical protein